jgi:hypothetical protein
MAGADERATQSSQISEDYASCKAIVHSSQIGLCRLLSMADHGQSEYFRLSHILRTAPYRVSIQLV